MKKQTLTRDQKSIHLENKTITNQNNLSDEKCDQKNRSALKPLSLNLILLIWVYLELMIFLENLLVYLKWSSSPDDTLQSCLVLIVWLNLWSGWALKGANKDSEFEICIGRLFYLTESRLTVVLEKLVSARFKWVNLKFSCEDFFLPKEHAVVGRTNCLLLIKSLLFYFASFPEFILTLLSFEVCDLAASIFLTSCFHLTTE